MIRMPVVIVTVLSAVALLVLEPLGPDKADVHKGLAIFLVIAILWITEAMHLTTTALLVPVLAVLLEVFSVREALNSFSHPIIFIFLGGFTLAAALKKKQLDGLIAYKIIALAKGKFHYAILLLFLVTALLSMWVSNTAVAAMILPLAFGLISSLDDTDENTRVFVLLGVAYSASIGGMGTIVGSPPNAIVGAALNLNFVDWMKVGIPIVLIMLPVLMSVLFFRLKPTLKSSSQLTISAPESLAGSGLVLVIFAATVLLWLFGKPISSALGIAKYFDAWVAIAAIIALVGTRALDWKDVESGADWGVLLLFGGGMALGAVLKSTGTSAHIAEWLGVHLAGVPFIVFLIFIVGFVIFSTELTSNTATAALLVPLFISISEQMSFSSHAVALGIGFAASCAFMLPVATPPNAIVYGSGRVTQTQMMSAGIRLNVAALLVLPGVLLLLL